MKHDKLVIGNIQGLKLDLALVELFLLDFKVESVSRKKDKKIPVDPINI